MQLYFFPGVYAWISSEALFCNYVKPPVISISFFLWSFDATLKTGLCSSNIWATLHLHTAIWATESNTIQQSPTAQCRAEIPAGVSTWQSNYCGESATVFGIPMVLASTVHGGVELPT